MIKKLTEPTAKIKTSILKQARMAVGSTGWNVAACLLHRLVPRRFWQRQQCEPCLACHRQRAGLAAKRSRAVPALPVQSSGNYVMIVFSRLWARSRVRIFASASCSMPVVIKSAFTGWTMRRWPGPYSNVIPAIRSSWSSSAFFLQAMNLRAGDRIDLGLALLSIVNPGEPLSLAQAAVLQLHFMGSACEHSKWLRNSKIVLKPLRTLPFCRFFSQTATCSSFLS